MLTAEDLAVFRGEHCLFRNVSFRVPAGGALQVTGPNGSGKTTLLRVLAGFIPLEVGRLTWQESPAEWGAATRGAVAYCGHLSALKGELTAVENLGFAAALAGEPAAAVPGALAAAGLARVADLPAAQLSAGQRRRLALARLPLAGAPLWILDEPQTNLDDAGKAYLRGLLAGHLAGGGLAVVASHEPAGLAGVATARLELGGA
jgi:heme exporter protein A